MNQQLPAQEMVLDESVDPGTRQNIFPGLAVAIVLKQDQPTGELTFGVVRDILTSAHYHGRGIKVRLTDGQVGRVHAVYRLPG